METVIEKIFENAPTIGALVIIVWMFIKHIDKTNANFVDTIHTLSRENLTARQESKRVIEENTKETARASMAMEHMTGALQEFLAHQKHQRQRT